MSSSGPRILLVGSTYRALCVLERLIERGDRVAAFIGQEGGGERDFCPEILEVCDRHSVPARSGRKLGEETVRWLEDRIRPDLALAVGLQSGIPLSVGGNSRLGLVEVVDRFGNDSCPGIVLRQRGQEIMRRELPAWEDDDEAGEVYLRMVEETVELIGGYLDRLGPAVSRPRAAVAFDPGPVRDDRAAGVSDRVEPGPATDAFEARIAERLEAETVLALGSPTAAFRMLFDAFDLDADDEILLPGLCSTAAVEAARATCARSVFVDVDEERLTLDPERLREAITPNSRVLVVSHAFGQPADLAPLYAIADEVGLEVIEDGGRSLGAHVGPHPLGKSPCTVVFQLPVGVPLPAAAAAIVTLAPELVPRVRPRAAPFRLGQGASELALAELDRLDHTLSTRRTLASSYSAELAPYDAFAVPRTPGDELPVYASYVLRLSHFSRTSADDLHKLLGEAGIETRRIHLPLSERDLVELPVTEDVVAHAVLLPLHADLDVRGQQLVLDTIFDYAIG